MNPGRPQQTERSPDVVLMDITLPDMPGQAVVRRIQQNAAWRDVPVLAITVWTWNGLEEHCLEDGFTLYRRKPVSTPERKWTGVAAEKCPT